MRVRKESSMHNINNNNKKNTKKNREHAHKARTVDKQTGSLVSFCVVWLLVGWMKSKEEIRQLPLQAFPVNRVMLVVSQNPITQPNIT